MAVLMYHSGRAASLSQRGRAREEVADDQPGQQGQDEAGLAGQAQRPGDAERLPACRRGGDVGVVAQQPAQVADGEHDREAEREAAQVQPQEARRPPSRTASRNR